MSYTRVPPTSVKQLRLTCKRFFHRIHNGYDQVIELTNKLRSLKNSEDVKISTISHCKGLLLCMTEDNRLVDTKINNNKSLDSYKILSCSHYYRKIPGGNFSIRQGAFEIYEFNSDSWRVTDAISGYENKKKSGYNYKILSCSYYYRGSSRYSDSTGSLKMKIWLTNSKTDEAKDLSWSEFLVCKVVIYDMTRMKSFLVDEENKKVLCCYKDHEYRTRIYIVGEDTYKNVYREVLQEQRSRVAPRLFSYVPSLVQIPTSQSNPFCKRKR
ncbi:hypothetical protein HID58_003135 [Brassica napus]|uniref:F-box associated beta-propeller type 1 domain-containing protein n=1 Tax=Brassica napus TaxID=3708 RepID=A0ABQ8EPA7_BRANA|nr:hypothetical protein HID58_003135 [Brassica napus]